MRMSDGVEWALHSCLALSWLGEGGPVPTARLAAAFELPAPYLNKHLQALARAGIVASTPGPKGGFRLARAPEDVTLLDVVTAIEGPEDAFRCQEIRQKGAGAGLPRKDFREECVIAGAMRTAEVAWRRELAARSIADIRATVQGKAPQAGENLRAWYAAG